MLSWIKKRCRRQSAPSGNSTKKQRKCSSSGSDARKQLYFEEKNTFPDLNHSYEEIPEFNTMSYLAYDLAQEFTPIHQALRQELSSPEVCLICLKEYSLGYPVTNGSLCTCYTEPKAAESCIEDYDVTDRRYSCDHMYSSITSEKRRRMFRQKSYIRKRPLPELPLEQEVDRDVSDCESSGYYENIDSDADISSVGPWMSDSILV
ncbi:hypothetical protein SNE40_012383 [Patella caerulea]|uniref:Uncharacterized protein n=1 Tax=Patella caerulea TaxID=87958 RepID=A0AAN8JUD8_PATCE